MSDDELSRVLAAIADEPDVRWRVYFRLLLILGSRRTELLSARWEHVDLDKSVWYLPDTKAKRSHVLPLPPDAVGLLRSLPSLGKSEFVFPGVGKAGHMMEPKKAWDRIRTAAKIPDVRVHDLRRTLGSRLAMSGESLHLIAKVLNHSQLATTQIYARLGLAPMRAALEKNAAAMMELSAK